MINKENDQNIDDTNTPVPGSNHDTAFMDVQCHIMIKDKDTGEILVNKRG